MVHPGDKSKKGDLLSTRETKPKWERGGRVLRVGFLKPTAQPGRRVPLKGDQKTKVTGKKVGMPVERMNIITLLGRRWGAQRIPKPQYKIRVGENTIE